MPDRLTEIVRDRVAQIVESRHGDPDAISESILIRDGFYCGRRFHAGTIEIVWFLEENELKVYENDAVKFVTQARPSGDEQRAA